MQITLKSFASWMLHICLSSHIFPSYRGYPWHSCLWFWKNIHNNSISFPLSHSSLHGMDIISCRKILLPRESAHILWIVCTTAANRYWDFNSTQQWSKCPSKWVLNSFSVLILPLRIALSNLSINLLHLCYFCLKKIFKFTRIFWTIPWKKVLR